MSKFFNQTLKLRSGALQEVGSKDTEFKKLVDAAFTSSTGPNTVEASWFERCEELQTPLTDLLKGQFAGNASIEAVLESYRALRTRLLKVSLQEGCRSIVVTSASQGEGKTFTSLNLASSCAQLHEMKVLLIDGDVRSRGLSRRLGAPAHPGLSDVLAGKCDPEQAVLATDIGNLYVMTSGIPSVPSAELFAASGWHELIEWCDKSFKLILVDSPPVLDLADVELMTAACDGVLMVVRALQTKRDVLQKTAGQIDRKKLLGVVYNAAESSANRYRYQSYGAEDK